MLWSSGSQRVRHDLATEQQQHGKNSFKVGTQRTYLNIIEAFYDKPTANVTLNGEKPKAFLLTSGTKQGCPLTTFLHHNTGSPSHSNQREKEVEGIQTGREEVEPSLNAMHPYSVTSVVCSSFWPYGLWSSRLLWPWASPGKTFRLPFPPPGDLPDPGIEPSLLRLLYCRQMLYHQGSPCADDVILYTEHPKVSIQKLLDLINELSKVAADKINTQKSVAFV